MVTMKPIKLGVNYADTILERLLETKFFNFNCVACMNWVTIGLTGVCRNQNFDEEVAS